MLTVTRQGDLAALAQRVRDVPARVIPYAASTALTRTAKLAQTEVIAEMTRVFDRPTRYTLSATRVEPSTIETLTARVAVKDQAAGGTVPEHYLLPEVEGGGRREKRFERALRFAGVLQAGERAVPGRGARLDAAGNIDRATVRSILSAVAAKAKTGRASRASKRGQREVFAGAVGRRATRGVWERDASGLKALLIFTRRAPRYAPRLDFEGAARRAAEANFEREFAKAAQALAQR